MYLYFWSLLLGVLGLVIGISISHSEGIAVFFGFLGLISPSIFIIDRIYKEVKKD